jgi:hypothetical protein
VAYHHPRAILLVKFRDGSLYHYFGVPRECPVDRRK